VNAQVDESLTASFISRDDLLAAKISAGRAQDLVDVAALRESRERAESDQLGTHDKNEFTRDADKGIDDDIEK
jgi:hypothetical protein